MNIWQRFFLPTVALAFVLLIGYRIWRSRELGPVHVAGMPTAALSDSEERALYLTAQGNYTAADIQANGAATPREKYRSFRARHDLRPRSGDPLCPITRTKANPACTWIIAGRSYAFCCPPCIDEFVQLAKTTPEAVRPPDQYVQP